jgi:hypothetical protein
MEDLGQMLRPHMPDKAHVLHRIYKVGVQVQVPRLHLLVSLVHAPNTLRRALVGIEVVLHGALAGEVSTSATGYQLRWDKSSVVLYVFHGFRPMGCVAVMVCSYPGCPVGRAKVQHAGCESALGSRRELGPRRAGGWWSPCLPLRGSLSHAKHRRRAPPTPPVLVQLDTAAPQHRNRPGCQRNPAYRPPTLLQGIWVA